MTTSHNGWDAIESDADTRLTPLPDVTGKVLAGPVWTLFRELAKRYSATVEPIRREWSWGHHYRMIRGSTTTLSNHASGTAVDFNAPKHPLGVGGTFKAAQVSAIRAILRDFEGVLRWGGDFGNRPDEMHWEIAPGVTEARVAALAAKLTAPAKPTPPLPPVAKPLLTVDGVLGPKTQAAIVKLIGATSWEARGNALQRWAGVKVDGIVGPVTLAAVQRKLGTTVTKHWDVETTRAFQRYINRGGR